MWIRSQDRMILKKVDSLQIEKRIDHEIIKDELRKRYRENATHLEYEEYVKNEYGKLGEIGILYCINDNDIELATYPTKQRALEVLDEVEMAIEESNVIRYEYFHGVSQQLIEYTYKDKQVYYMPKDSSND